MPNLSIISIAMSLIATSALAADKWDCMFTTPEGPPGASAHASIRLEGYDLVWMLDAFEIPNPKVQVAVARFRYRILENNSVGLVAVSSQARVDKDVGPLVSSETVVLNKTNGVLRVGEIGTNGLHDTLSGTCRPK